MRKNNQSEILFSLNYLRNYVSSSGDFMLYGRTVEKILFHDKVYDIKESEIPALIQKDLSRAGIQLNTNRERKKDVIFTHDYVTLEIKFTNREVFPVIIEWFDQDYYCINGLTPGKDNLIYFVTHLFLGPDGKVQGTEKELRKVIRRHE